MRRATDRRAWAIVAVFCALVTVGAGTLGAAVVTGRGPAPLDWLAGRLGLPAPQRAAGSASPGVAPAVLTPAPLPDGNDWTQYRYDVRGTGDNPEGVVGAADVDRLAARWVVQVGGGHRFLSTPAVLGGRIYVTLRNSLLAFGLLDGADHGRVDDLPQQVGAISSSVAVDPFTRVAYYGTPDARVYAVNLLTHRRLWQARLGDSGRGAYIWSSPLLVDGKLYIGLASFADDPCVRGGVFALDPATGKLLWSHYTVPDGDLGGGVWSSVTADPDAGEVIVTTGNPCTSANAAGEEDSILGLDWDTGRTLWQYQAIAHDTCDCDFGGGAVNFTYQGTKYVVAGNKAGRVYALVPPATPGGAPTVAWSRTLAGVVGDSTGGGLFDLGGIYEPPSYRDGLIFVAGGPTLDGACAQGALWALRAGTGAVAWRQCTLGQVVGPSAISQDALFVPEQGALVAYRAGTGEVVWQARQDGAAAGGVAVARGFVVAGTTAGRLYCYALPAGVAGP